MIFAVLDFRGITKPKTVALTLLFILLRNSQHGLQIYQCVCVSNSTINMHRHLNFNFCDFFLKLFSVIMQLIMLFCVTLVTEFTWNVVTAMITLI